MSNELLPCPFCGNELYRSPRNHNPKAYCVTEDCYGKRMSVVNLDDPIIVAMWNARAGAAATPAPKPAAIARILNDCFYTGEPGQHEAICAALNAILGALAAAAIPMEAKAILLDLAGKFRKEHSRVFSGNNVASELARAADALPAAAAMPFRSHYIRGQQMTISPDISGELLLADLVARFSKALLEKLCDAQAKGRRGWDNNDWEDDCRRGLLKHLAKGDPRDVAAYCAFMWHHGWSTKLGPDVAATPLPTKLTGEMACILENCDPPENQTPEAVAALIADYQPTWDRIVSAVSRPNQPVPE